MNSHAGQRFAVPRRDRAGPGRQLGVNIAYDFFMYLGDVVQGLSLGCVAIQYWTASPRSRQSGQRARPFE